MTLAATMTMAVPIHSGAATSTACGNSVNFLWPERTRAWAHKVVHRESRGVASARNRSGASGCFQLMPVHAPRFARLGFSWERDRFNPIINTWIAMDLFKEQGVRPWK